MRSLWIASWVLIAVFKPRHARRRVHARSSGTALTTSRVARIRRLVLKSVHVRNSGIVQSVSSSVHLLRRVSQSANVMNSGTVWLDTTAVR